MQYESFPYERGYGEFYRHSIYRDSLPYWKYSEKVSGHIVSIAGIFPLVPGIGIYRTIYYTLMKESAQSLYYGRQTVGIALAMVL